MKTTIAFLCYLLFFPLILCAQTKYVHVTVKVPAGDLHEFSLYQYGINNQLFTDQLDTVLPINPFITSHSNIKDAGTEFTDTYSIRPFIASHLNIKIDHEGMYGIQDGIWTMFRHDIFLRPGDTIDLVLNDRPNYEDQLKSKHAAFTRHIMQVRARFPGNITFFDEIDPIHPVKYGLIQNETLATYKADCDSIYTVWLKKLNDYIKQKLVSADFIPYAKAELSARYISWMLTPLTISKAAISKDYCNGLDTFDYNNPVFITSLKTYTEAAILYNNVILNHFNSQAPYANLKNEFQSILQHFTGQAKNYLMAAEIGNYIGKGNPDFDNVYQQFVKTCTNEKIKRTIAEKLQAMHLAREPIAGSHIQLADVLKKTVLITPADKNEILIKVVDSTKPCLIDCWATWCGPCLEQIPFLKKIEKKFKDSVQFISLSFDKDSRFWNYYIAKNRSKLPGDQYRLYSGSDSLFKKYFNLNTIPRYILLSAKGIKVLNVNLPHPFLTDQFEKILRKSYTKNL